MPKKIRANVLRLPQGIKPESIQRAGEVVQAFTKHLRTLGSVEFAVAKTTKETGARAETKTPQDKDKK
jgi:hypothetical protein